MNKDLREKMLKDSRITEELRRELQEVHSLQQERTQDILTFTVGCSQFLTIMCCS